MYCTNCGKQLVEADNFCSGCGKPIARENDDSPKASGDFISALASEKEILKVKKPKSPNKIVLTKVILFVLGVFVLLQIFFILTGDLNWRMSVSIWQSVWWIIAYGSFAFVAIDLYEKTTFRSVAICNFALIVVAFILSILLAWRVIDYSNFILTLWVLSIGFMHCSIMLMFKFKHHAMIKYLYAVIAILITTYLIYIFMLNVNPNTFSNLVNDLVERIFFVFITLSIFGTVAMFLLKKIYKVNESEDRTTDK